jgi:hypothetical protein
LPQIGYNLLHGVADLRGNAALQEHKNPKRIRGRSGFVGSQFLIMENRWFTSMVVLTWLATTTWLVVSKVLPPLRRGEPPSYRSMYNADGQSDPPVGWEMSIGGKPLGWAITRVEPNGEKATRVYSHIHFDQIPLEEFSQAWMRTIIRSALRSADTLQMDADSELQIDSLGHLSNFISTLHPAGFSNTIRIRGRVQGSQLNISIEAGEGMYHFETYLPADSLVADELSPQPRMVGLHLGQEWTVPVFSPLRDPTMNLPIEILQAKVESRDLLMWDDKAVPVNVVVYRADSGSALSSTQLPRSKLWVCDDGTVLKQEVAILKAKLLFSRLSTERSALLDLKSREEEANWGRTRAIPRQLPDLPRPAEQPLNKPASAPASQP